MLFRSQPAGQGQMGPSPLGQIKDILGGLSSIAGQRIAGVTGDQTLGDWLGTKLSDLFKNPYNVTPPADSMDPNSPNFIGPIQQPEQVGGLTNVTGNTGGITYNTDGSYTTSEGITVNPDGTTQP